VAMRPVAARYGHGMGPKQTADAGSMESGWCSRNQSQDDGHSIGDGDWRRRRRWVPAKITGGRRLGRDGSAGTAGGGAMAAVRPGTKGGKSVAEPAGGSGVEAVRAG
jgi:hypothetical protein